MKKYKIYSYPEGWEDVLDSEKAAELIDEVRRSFQRASEEIKANPPTAETLEAIRKTLRQEGFFEEKE